MALQAVQVSDVPSSGDVKDPLGVMCKIDYITALLDRESEKCERKGKNSSKFMVIGHRGSGMNKLPSSDERVEAIRENTVKSFKAAAKSGVQFIEFDVQVTRDAHAVIFHDDTIITREKQENVEKRITELTLEEFLNYGFQKDKRKVGKPLLRRDGDGKILDWNVSSEDCLCTLQEAFQNVDPSVGFNIELKFEDETQYSEDQLREALQVILKDVNENANDRHIFFSSFHPDAAQLMRREQNSYPVFFLTKGGTQTYKDCRRNSLEAAVQVCIEGGLQGIVSEVKAILQNPEAIVKIKESKLCFLTFGQLNNSADAVYIQRLIGVDGVIVDFVGEIAAAVAELTSKSRSVELENAEIQQIDQNQRQPSNYLSGFSTLNCRVFCALQYG